MTSKQIGLKEYELDLILSVLRLHEEVTGALVFGSRAKGSAADSSDIDLALEGEVDLLRAEAIASELEELPLPYRFDVKSLAGITNPALREHIDRVGVRILG
ncbi:MAG: nucleotidyltransferase domain-containing protein [Planctomycetes bacterium]|nr:nucleotidyltransferase domain-containing protein [Planctomycetota bacterium]